MAIKIPKLGKQPTSSSMDTSPYTAPTSQVNWVDYDGQYNDSKFYSMSGRIGRIQYLAYPTLCYFCLLLIMLLVFLVLGGFASLATGQMSSSMMMVFSVLLLVLMPVVLYVTFVTTIRRLNDLNKSGWLSLLLLVPIVQWFLQVYLIFMRGDNSINDYGLPAKPPSRALVILGVGLPIFLGIVGALSAIMLPAYVNYTERVEQAQIQPVTAQVPVTTPPAQTASTAPASTEVVTPAPVAQSAEVKPEQAVNQQNNSEITGSQMESNQAESAVAESAMAESQMAENAMLAMQDMPKPSIPVQNASISDSQQSTSVNNLVNNEQQNQGGISYAEYVKLSENAIYVE